MRYLLLILCVLVVGCDRPTSEPFETSWEKPEAKWAAISHVFAKSDFRGPGGTCFIDSETEWEPVAWTRTFIHAKGFPIAIPAGVVDLRVELCKGRANPCVGQCGIDFLVPTQGGNLVRGWGETLLTLAFPVAEWRGLRVQRSMTICLLGLDMGSHLKVSYRVKP